MNYPNGNSEYKTACGTCVSIFISVITFAYLCFSIASLLNHENTVITNSTLDSYFSYNEIFTQDDGLMFAIGIKDNHNSSLLNNKLELKAFKIT